LVSDQVHRDTKKSGIPAEKSGGATSIAKNDAERHLATGHFGAILFKRIFTIGHWKRKTP
jgi:hypothetical protein